MINSLSCYCVNINGFMSKMDSLSSILENIQPYVVVLNEVRVDNAGTLKTFYKPRGYNILPRVK